MTQKQTSKSTTSSSKTTPKRATTTTKVASLTKNDIVSIIEACGKNNVASLEFKGLNLRLNPNPQGVIPEQPQVIFPENMPVEEPSVRPDPKTGRDFESDEKLEAELDQLAVTDPEAWQQAHLSKDPNDDRAVYDQ